MDRLVHILYGPPGSGKTSCADQLRSQVTYVSVGELARAEMASSSPLGQELSRHLAAVVEYPQSLIYQLMADPIRSAAGTRLLDGFPKFPRELPVLERIMQDYGLVPGRVITLEVSLATALRRATVRRICPACLRQYDAPAENCADCAQPLTRRDDDSEPLLRRRYGDFLDNHQQICAGLAQIGFELDSVDAEQAQDAVYSTVLALLAP